MSSDGLEATEEELQEALESVDDDDTATADDDDNDDDGDDTDNP